MSSKVTKASARRMEEREHFANLTPGPYCDIIGREDGLPRLSIELHGRRESEGFALSVIAAIDEHLMINYPALKIVTRKTA